MNQIQANEVINKMKKQFVIKAVKDGSFVSDDGGNKTGSWVRAKRVIDDLGVQFWTSRPPTSFTVGETVELELEKRERADGSGFYYVEEV